MRICQQESAINVLRSSIFTVKKNVYFFSNLSQTKNRDKFINTFHLIFEMLFEKRIQKALYFTKKEKEAL